MNRGSGSRRGPLVLLLVGVLAAGLAVPAAADSPEPRLITTWGTSGTGDEEFNVPGGVAVAPDGTVYVADTANHRIQAFDPAGTFQATWGDSGDGDGQFSFPAGVAVAPDGTVYVADTANSRIQAFDPAGTFQAKWGESGDGDGQFDLPRGVAVAPDGTVYVADTGNHRIQIFDPAGTFQGKWGESGDGDGQFNNPRGMAVGLHGTVYVADAFNNRIQFFDPAGTFQGKWGESGNGDGQFNVPRGVAASSFGVVYVADLNNHRVQKFAFPSVTRAAGPNRFATATAISQTHHPMPQAVDTVFVATGANFPDALAGAVAAAFSRAPLLLTSSVPGVTAGELDRLDPDQIVILGGTAVVSTATAGELAAWGTVVRLAGANRYETAVAISQHTYPAAGSADTVVVATGENFADALAGATLAALRNGPVLLTQPNALPGDVAAEIQRLDPDNILVLGGTAAVSDAVLGQLSTIAPTGRIAGANRFATAVEISKEAFPTGAGVVYVAVGTNFPDALAGAAQAAASGAPVLLTPTDALPQSVIDEIGRLDPYAVVILGGTAVISPAVEAQLEALLGI